MDEIYKVDPKTCPFVSEIIDIKASVSQISQRAKGFETKMLKLKLKNVTSGQSLSLQTFSDKFNVRNDSFLNVNDVEILKSKPLLFAKPVFSDECLGGIDLQTVEAAKRRSGMPNFSKMKLKYRGIRWLEDGRSDKASTASGLTLVPNQDFSVSVRVYHPLIHMKGSQKNGRPKLCQEVVMYGTQTLAQLRGMIMCNTDMAVNKDMSNNPREPINERAFELYKSGFIFINNVFYNDLRDPTCIDYSTVIRTWASEHNIGPLSTGLLDQTRLVDLTLQLGYPYVYQHQGNCEHILVFTNIRLLAHDDALQARNYPYVRSIPHRRARMCMVCGKFIAKWVTEGSDRVPVDPCYFCDSCFHSYNYIDGKKVGEFKAFPYIDRSILI